MEIYISDIEQSAISVAIDVLQAYINQENEDSRVKKALDDLVFLQKKIENSKKKPVKTLVVYKNYGCDLGKKLIDKFLDDGCDSAMKLFEKYKNNKDLLQDDIRYTYAYYVDTAILNEEITVKIPDEWDLDKYSWYGSVQIVDPFGNKYLPNDILCGNEKPCFRTYDYNRNYKDIIELEVIEDEN